MSYCKWPALTKGSVCLRCGKVELKRDYDTPPVCVCKPKLGLQPKVQPQLQQGGLGTEVESLLKSFGITQERYKEVKTRFGLPATCNCHDRIAALNNWGARVSAWWRGLGGGVE